jgi:hypothetical protein
LPGRSNRALVNWQKLSIATGETRSPVRRAAAVLNQAFNANPFAILGILTSKGQVYRQRRPT